MLGPSSHTRFIACLLPFRRSGGKRAWPLAFLRLPLGRQVKVPILMNIDNYLAGTLPRFSTASGGTIINTYNCPRPQRAITSTANGDSFMKLIQIMGPNGWRLRRLAGCATPQPFYIRFIEAISTTSHNLRPSRLQPRVGPLTSLLQIMNVLELIYLPAIHMNFIIQSNLKLLHSFCCILRISQCQIAGHLIFNWNI